MRPEWTRRAEAGGEAAAVVQARSGRGDDERGGLGGKTNVLCSLNSLLPSAGTPCDHPVSALCSPTPCCSPGRGARLSLYVAEERGAGPCSGSHRS